MMTTYSVKNGGFLDKAFRVHDGFKVVVAGEEAEVTTTEPLTEDQIEAFAQDKVKVVLLSGDPDETSDNGGKLDRDDLKKQAAELGLEYPRNISTEKLNELIDAKLAE